MVALAPQPLPTLSPNEAARFAALIRLHLNLEALADQLATPIHTLIAWASTPRIQAWIDAYRTLHNACLELQRIHFQTHAMTALSAALDHLTKAQPTNPVEIRRAASALVSATNAAFRAARNPSPQNPRPDPTPTTPAPTPAPREPSLPRTSPHTQAPTSRTQDAGPRTTPSPTPTSRTSDSGPRTSAPSTAAAHTPTLRTEDRGPRTSTPPDPLSRPHRPRPASTLLARAGVPP